MAGSVSAVSGHMTFCMSILMDVLGDALNACKGPDHVVRILFAIQRVPQTSVDQFACSNIRGPVRMFEFH